MKIFFSVSEHRLPCESQVGKKIIFYIVNGGRNESRQKKLFFGTDKLLNFMKLFINIPSVMLATLKN